MAYILSAVMGYFLGCSNMAYYFAKWKHVDLTADGSGNLGTSNTVLLIGWLPGILVAVHDIGKAVLAVLLARLLFPETEGVAALAGAACVMGHIFPVFLKFKGGKGFASYIGLALALNWKFALVILAIVVAVTVIFDYIVIGTTVTVLSLPCFLFFTHAGWIAILAASVATAVILFKHRENYVRIAKGTEFGLRSAVKKEHIVQK